MAAGDGTPRRRSSDHHFHPEYWTEAEQHRFEDRISREIHELRTDFREQAQRLTLILGGLSLLIFLLPLLAPFLRNWLGLP